MPLALAATLLLSSALPEAYFPFVIPWDALAPGSAVDVSSLSDGPAGGRGFVVARNGAFVESGSGRRVRFFATNLGARAFASKEDADKIARGMAQLGINLVRVREVDPGQLEQLDSLVHALKERGIYVTLSLGPLTDHAIDLFDRRSIEAQKDQARALLDRTNTVTGVAYKDEPALAFVEMGNESSLVGRPGEPPGEGLDALPEPFLGEIVSLWNAWLSGRYGDDDRLAAAWTETLGPEESLAGGKVRLATDAAPGQRQEDWTEFLMATERAHAEEMRRFLVGVLGIRANVIDTQGRWPHRLFERAPLVDEMDKTQGVLGALALERVAGRPFTMPEYDHPPNDYRAETLPLLSTFALLQDWDAFSDSGLDSTTVAFYPSSALLFRKGVLLPLAAMEIVGLPDRSWRRAKSAADAWRQTGGIPDTLLRRTAVAPGKSEAFQREKAGAPVPVAVVARSARGAVYRIDSPPAKILTGFLGGERFTLSGLTISFPDFGRNGEGFGSLTLVDLEGNDLATTRRALLTLVGGALNQLTGPVAAEGIPCVVSIPTTRGLKVYPLDASGRRKAAIPMIRREDRLTFRVGPESKTLWYEITNH